MAILFYEKLMRKNIYDNGRIISLLYNKDNTIIELDINGCNGTLN